MMIGVGAGQQSRVDCVKLAGRKVSSLSPTVRELPCIPVQHPAVQCWEPGPETQPPIHARLLTELPRFLVHILAGLVNPKPETG